jgi:2,5-diketo-D-gluconate reductase A
MGDIPSITLNDGNKIPMLGLGTSRLANAYKAVTSALEAGYRHIDTAAMYGNEEEVGRAVRDSSIPRDEIFITTKLSNDNHGDVKRAFEGSLKRLGLGYIDLYLIHWPMPGRLDGWVSLNEMKDSGAPVKSLGVSNFTIRHLEELLNKSDKVPAVNQVEFNPFINQQELLVYNQGKGILMEAYSPMTRANRLADSTVKAISESHDKSPAQVLLRWSIQQGVAVIPKAQDPEHQLANMDIFNWQLTAEDMERLGGLNDGFRVTEDPERYA